MVQHEKSSVETVSAPVLAQLFDVSEQTIRDYVAQGLVVRIGRGKYDKDASTRLLMRHLRDTAAGRGGTEAVRDLTVERARLASEQADAQALRNGVVRGEYVRADEVLAEWEDGFAMVRANMMTTHIIAQQRLPHLTKHDVRVLDEIVRDLLTRSSNDEAVTIGEGDEDGDG